MSDYKQIMGTYKSIGNWHKFRLRLFLEGILVGVFAGLVISCFRWGLNEAEQLREVVYQILVQSNTMYIAGWFVTLLLIGILLKKMTAFEPMAAGSGIPQVKGALLGLIKMRWFHVIWVKLTAGIMGIGAGLSLGREGPSIQLGAAAAQGVSRLLGRTRLEERYLMTSGASAGLAAAFNAPLAGVIFALEELHRNFSIVVLLPSMAAAMTATVVSRLLFGSDTVFAIPNLKLLPINYYGIVIVTAAVIGYAGVIFNKGLLNIGRFYSTGIFKNQLSKIIFALLTAGVLGFFVPEVLGGGNDLINQLAQAPAPLTVLIIFLVGKFLFTLLSYGCGVPGGFFLPLLVVGALCGSVCANILVHTGLIEAGYAANIVVIAMTALFSSSVRAPITGTVLIMEMTASYQQLLTLAIAAMVAFVVAELFQSKPIYEELLDRMLQKDRPADEVLEQRNVVEFVVGSDSSVANKLIRDISWPPHTLLVDVKRGEKQLVPSGNTRLLAGDFIYVLTKNEFVEQLQKMISGDN